MTTAVTNPRRFSDEQLLAIARWFGAAEPARDVLRRMEFDNAAQSGLCPWPKATVEELDLLRVALAPMIADIRLKRQEDAIAAGLGRREQQIADLNDRLSSLHLTIEQLDKALLRLIAQGALEFDDVSLSTGGAVNNPKVFEGELVGSGGRAALAQIKTALAAGIDPARVFIKDGQFKRARDLVFMIGDLEQRYSQLYLVLGRVSASFDRDKPVDWAGRRKVMANIANRVDAARQLLAAESDTDADPDLLDLDN